MITIRVYTESDRELWDAYVYTHPESNLYQLSGWKNVIEKTYGHRTYYLIAESRERRAESKKAREQRIGGGRQRAENRGQTVEDRQSSSANETAKNTSSPSAMSYELNANKIVGVLPLVHLKHFLFGNNLISMPYFDMGGILADDEEAERALLREAIDIGQHLKVDAIELRHTKPLPWLSKEPPSFSTHNPPNNRRTNPKNSISSINLVTDVHCSSLPAPCSVLTKSHKVRMILDLPDSSEDLMKSFKSKLRSQIKKPIKEGLVSNLGGIEFLEPFYEVFATNMRDLGSPVHSKKLMQSVLEEFSGVAKIIIVHKDEEPVACSLVMKFDETLQNPWASALRQYSRLSPNMLIYWTMLEHACDNDCRVFDFGRSSPDEGTFKFKQQWGALPQPLNWQYIYLKGSGETFQPTEKSKFERAISFWKKLPVSVTKIFGPRIRKHIGL